MQFVSLDGVRGKPDYGLSVVSTAGTTTFTVTEQVANINTRRVWLLLSNTGSFGIRVKFRDTEGKSPSATFHEVLVGGSIQIDKHIPFTGALDVVGVVAGDSSYTLTEASVRE